MPTSKWFAVSNRRLPELAALGTCEHVGELYVYHRGLADPLPSLPPFEVSVGRLAVDPAPDGSSRSAQRTTIRVDEDTVLVSTSSLNHDPVYVCWDRRREYFACFSDIFLAPLVLPGLDVPVGVRRGTLDPEGETTLVPHVSRLTNDTVHEIHRTRRGWVTKTMNGRDPLAAYRKPSRYDPVAAGHSQLDALRRQIERIASARPGAAYATLLSGGIDSGTVTYLAADIGLSVRPYSVATPWGDELDDAGELADYLGLNLVPVVLDENDIMAAVPEAVRWLGHTTPETVEIALTATAVYRAGAIEANRVLLTGYGSDLINAGLYTPFDHPGELIEQGLHALHRTRFSNELANLMPGAYGREVFHPFMTWPVIRVALDTAPTAKVRNGREKFHLRTAMSAHVPQAVAWRRKVAVHHGGGLQDGVIRRLARDTGHEDRELTYRACFAELMSLAAQGRLDDWEGADLYQRAVAAAGEGRALAGVG